jgi:hypothetical protein
MATYNGYPSWNQWNVSLWINNDESLYRLALSLVKQHGAGYAAVKLTNFLRNEKTPDGAIYNLTSVRGALMGIAA